MPAALVVARPLPTVFQPKDIPPQRSRVVSFSSDSFPSSNPHSGESWFQVPSSQECSSQSSNSSHPPPLPKGARPASPQPTRPLDLDTRTFGLGTDQSPTSLKRSGTFSSWKLEWRGLSKVVKWAIKGKELESEAKAHRRGSRARRGRPTDTDNDISRERLAQRLDKPLPQDPPQPQPSFSPYLYAEPTSPLSPNTSATCVDLSYDAHYSRSELGHGMDVPESEVHFLSHRAPSIQDDLLRRHRSVQASRHEIHARESKYTNERRAASELGHSDPYGTAFDTQNAFSDVDHSTTSHETSIHWSTPHRVAHSDIGHAHGQGAMPPSAFPSTLSLSYGHDSINVKSGTKFRSLKTFQTFRSVQSAIALPVSIPTPGSPLTPHQRPRKLRKSIKAMPLLEARTNIPLNYSSSSKPPNSYGPPASKQSFYAAALTAPLVPPKPAPRPARKLTKRPSPALPPLPRPDSRDVAENPPPVPPKTTSILRNKSQRPIAPEYESHSAGISTESHPALTDTSASTSPDEEFHSPQHSSATSVEANASEANANALPPKRPSLLRTESNRRWTVAVADVPDDLFLEELERLRRMGMRAGEVHGIHNAPQTGYTITSTVEKHKVSTNYDTSKRLEVKHVERSKVTNAVLVQEVGVEDEMEWLHARRAILCCRELVRTERSYQERLQELADGSVSDAVPALLIQYLPALIGGSKVLSTRFNEDMSASGVTNAFLSVVSTLEAALVPWSGIVGEFFGGNRTSPNMPKRKRDATFPGIITEEDTHTEFGAIKVRCMSMNGNEKAFATRTSSAPMLAAEAISTSSSSHWLFRPAFTVDPGEVSEEKDTLSGLRKSFRRREARKEEEKERRRKPPFRDLAILPTQRVTRYVLLYKDLLKHTPVSSPSRGLVEKAVATAIQLAQKCDRAQDNSTFLR